MEQVSCANASRSRKLSYKLNYRKMLFIKRRLISRLKSGFSCGCVSATKQGESVCSQVSTLFLNEFFHKKPGQLCFVEKLDSRFIDLRLIVFIKVAHDHHSGEGLYLYLDCEAETRSSAQAP